MVIIHLLTNEYHCADDSVPLTPENQIRIPGRLAQIWADAQACVTIISLGELVNSYTQMSTGVCTLPVHLFFIHSDLKIFLLL